MTTKVFGHKINYFEVTKSTNDDIWKFLENNSNEGLLTITDHQENGRGRRGNKWLSRKGNNLLYSYLIKPNLPIDKIGLLSLLTGVSVVEGIIEFTNLQPKLKWPNDIFFKDKKLGGILAESKFFNGELYVVMGVGLNVNEINFPVEIAKSATSLRIIKNYLIKREPLIASILNKFEVLYNKHYTEWLKMWNLHCNHIDSEVKFHHQNEIINGQFLRINDLGQAILNVNGEIKTISTGTIKEI